MKEEQKNMERVLQGNQRNSRKRNLNLVTVRLPDLRAVAAAAAAAIQTKDVSAIY